MPQNHENAQTDEPRLSSSELREVWPLLLDEDRIRAFDQIPEDEAEDFFFSLDTADQAELLRLFPLERRTSWMRALAPDDAADVIQEAPEEERADLLALLDEPTRKEVTALLAYPEDEAGGIMSPRFVAVSQDINVDQAIAFLRTRAGEEAESLYYTYVLDGQKRLVGVVSFRDLITARGDRKVRDIMREEPVTVSEDLDQEAVSRLFSQHDLKAIPVVDDEGRMKGIVSVDDIIDVLQEEVTEDIQKIGGSQVLEGPYLEVGFGQMIRKRAIWLSVLFVSEMLTATAMAHYESEIQAAVVLALFIPLIISSGGNSGTQASTLLIRAMALGEVRLRDWWKIFGREALIGLSLGGILGSIALVRIIFWPARASLYGPHYLLLAATVSVSLVGVVLWGTVTGSMLPMLLRRIGLDPASASAPFVATLADVTGIVIYFTIAKIMLGGILL